MNQIVNRYEVTERVYKQWIMEAKTEGIKLALMLYWCIVAVACLVLSAVYGWPGLFIIVALYAGYRGLLRDFVVEKKMYSTICSGLEGNVWIRTVTVTGETVTVDDGKTLTTYKVTEVVKVREDRFKIRVFLNNKSSLRLYKDSFVEGTADECVNLLKPTGN